MTRNLSTDDKTILVASVKLFEHLDYDVVADIARELHFARFRSGHKLFEFGATGHRLYIVVDGEVEVRIPHMANVASSRMRKGAVLGEMSLLSQDKISADIIATESTTALYLEREQFMTLIHRHPAFSKTMSDLMTERLEDNDGKKQVGRFTLQHKLGEGSMASVYQAHDPLLERKVAIKMLRYELSQDDTFIERFKREAKTIAHLNHPNIIDVYETIEAFSTHFMVMEKLPGRNLMDVLNEQGPLSIKQAREILYQVAGALEYAHNFSEQPIVHRDIKPSNIIIDDHGHVKLTDFGIAKPPTRGEETIEGSPIFLAPEVIRGETVDGRADIYALGVMAFYMLTGIPPFNAKSVQQVLAKHLHEPPPDIRKWRPDIDHDMAKFIDQALTKDPQQRISNWKMIKIQLEPSATREQINPRDDEVTFITKMRCGSYQQAAKVINHLKKLMESDCIEFDIQLVRQPD